MSESTKFLFLTAAYAVFWIGTFGYVFFMYRRQRALEKELDALKTLLDHRTTTESLSGDGFDQAH
jgi:CcmD family protein